MADICVPRIEKVIFGIDMIIHLTLLFVVLSLFFTFYMSKEIKHHFDGLVVGTVNNVTPSLLANVPNVLPSEIVLDRVSKYYGKEDPTIQKHNQWLFKTLLIMNSLFVAFTVLAVVGAKMLCVNVPIKHILLENGLIIGGVALVEFIFFKFIAIHYNPIPPSLMMKTMVDSVKKNASA